MGTELYEQGSPWALILFCLCDRKVDIPDIHVQAGDFGLTRRLYEDIKKTVQTILETRGEQGELELSFVSSEMGPKTRTLFGQITELVIGTTDQFMKTGVVHGVAIVAGAWIDRNAKYHWYLDLAGGDKSIQAVLDILSTYFSKKA